MKLEKISLLVVLKNKIFNISGSPKYIAKGFALGSFIGMLPFPGFQMFISLGIASIIKVNRKAACIGVFNTNLVTGIFIFAFNYWLGKILLGFQSDLNLYDEMKSNFLATLYNSGRETFLALLLGGLITGIIASIISYYLVLTWYNKKNSAYEIE
ncbi:MAG: DUF2062 domain-containing protein [Cellulophaga sp.]